MPRRAQRRSSQQSDDDIESLRDLASGAPVVRALNDLLERAVELRASDIHIEPFRTGLVVRMRVDGLLRAMPAPSGIPPQALISRVKILAGLNIAERRLPQDGAARVRVSRSELDVRVATMPTQHGESAVIRLLPRDRGLLEMGKLGLSPRDETIMTRLLALPHGMIVVTGPTGSGKTTTLATMLSILNEPTRKILTIEDPVEYEIPGINQSQVKPSIGLTFASAMRSFVRQDPDVIMVGEIRDAETAHIAIHAALTGHLVLTTLHTETAAAAVPRLIDLGIEGFLLKSTLRAVVAQRLVRVLCDRCKVPHTLTAADIDNDPRFAVIGFKAGEVDSRGRRLRALRRHRLSRPQRRVRDPRNVRRGPQTDRAADRFAHHRYRRDARRHDHDAGGRGREMPRRADHRARGFPRHDDAVSGRRRHAF